MTNKSPNHGYLRMGGTLLLDGSQSGCQVPGEGPRGKLEMGTEAKKGGWEEN